MSNPFESESPSAAPDHLTHARARLRACVHCGFCNATCPTYTLSGDEREGPRGRLYLMNNVLAGTAQGADLTPLDHCLSCRSCETTCPAGVPYTEILDIVREHTQELRPWHERIRDRALATALGARRPLAAVLRMARRARRLAPPAWKRRIIPAEAGLVWPVARHARRVALLQGCVQPALLPTLDIKAAIILDHLGISACAIGPHCCGALPYHLHAHEQGRADAQEVLALYAAGAYDGLVSTATGCTAFLKDYPRLLATPDAPGQGPGAAVREIAELIDPAVLPPLPPSARRRIAWHAPCSLQHALKGAARVEAILKALGHTLVPVAEAALCCGSAGPYSLRHPRWGRALGRRKWKALTAQAPELVVTANVGCLQHLAGQGNIPVRHWIDLVYAALTNPDTDAHGLGSRADQAPPSPVP